MQPPRRRTYDWYLKFNFDKNGDVFEAFRCFSDERVALVRYGLLYAVVDAGGFCPLVKRAKERYVSDNFDWDYKSSDGLYCVILLAAASILRDPAIDAAILAYVVDLEERDQRIYLLPEVAQNVGCPQELLVRIAQCDEFCQTAVANNPSSSSSTIDAVVAAAFSCKNTSALQACIKHPAVTISSLTAILEKTASRSAKKEALLALYERGAVRVER